MTPLEPRSPVGAGAAARLAPWVAAGAVLAGLLLLAGYDYLLFHSVVEVAGIAVAFAIFLLVWNTRAVLPDSFFLLIGTAFLFIGGLDLVHTLAYKGMGIFPGNSSDVPTQLWLAARYFQAVVFLAAALLIGRTLTKDRRYDAAIFVACCAGLSGLLVASIFVWDVFPTAFVEGSGLTPFKIGSEYVIALLMLATIGALAWKREHFDGTVFLFLVAAEGFLIAGELAFTSYASVYGFMNLLGHLLRVASVYCFYRAIVVVGLTRPTDLLFRELTAREEALRRSEQRYRSLVEFAPDAIYVNRNDRVEYVNPAALQLFGAAAPEDVIGRHPLDLYHPAYRDMVAERIRRLWGGEPAPLADEQIVRLDGSVRDVEVAGFSFVDEAGPAIEVVLRDVTDRKTAERQRAEYADRLAASNEDLQQFAYVASHDLQEPLRSIVSFSQLLERRYRGRLDTDADEFIAFIIEGGTRMQTLIQDLLAFSRVASTATASVPVEAERAFAEAVAGLDSRIRETGALVTLDPLPAVLGDPTQLAQVFSNLIGNAIKYRRPDDPPRVHVSARRDGPLVEFAVRDNGIGIAPGHFERIFVIFQRLHTRDEYDGTGIGLAIVKRLVDRHGGTVRVESTPGEGSTFFFTLPAA